MRKITAIAFLWIPVLGNADERILDFQSDILIRHDSRIEVTETIKVRAEGSRIRRGIYRDYPTAYKDRYGNRVEVEYEPRSVLRDGQSEAFHTKKLRNGIRTYFGRSNYFLSPGEYTYTYRYDAGRMLGFFDSWDELYWNVTGNGWDFPIDRAGATVSFDFEVPVDSVGETAFTGPYGASGEDYSASRDARGRVGFETTRPLARHEGLTIVVTFPKGYVTPPSGAERIGWFLSDNLNVLIMAAGLMAMMSYYIPVWLKYGRDPAPGLIVARYEPPRGFSPASLRYIERMQYDDKVMTAAVVNLAVKGYLRIDSTGDDYSLRRLASEDNRPELAPGEKELLQGLFRDNDFVILDQENHVALGEARSEHKRSLRKDYRNRYFQINGLLNLPAVLVAFTTALVALTLGDGPTPLVVAGIVLSLGVLVSFAIIMRRPTISGRKLLDEALGFKEYLEIAEKDELNLRHPPEKTPELFEKYLPFALALGVEQEWADRFAGVFAGLQGGAAYQPGWYNGPWNSMRLGSTTSSLTSNLGSAISASVTPPGSSSGSSGFSGGGGGGGGGGGW